MGFWDAVVLIVLIVAIAWLRSGKSRRRDDPAPAIAQRDDLESEVIELRKRIAVLERIATDERKSREISAEIDALRSLD